MPTNSVVRAARFLYSKLIRATLFLLQPVNKTFYVFVTSFRRKYQSNLSSLETSR